MTPKRKLQIEAGKLWRIAVFTKWGHLCTICDNPATDPHHYIERSKNGLLRYEVDNGVPICRTCHGHLTWGSNAVKHRLCEIIREKRGLDWRMWIDFAEKKHDRSFVNVGWFKEQIEKLKKSLKYVPQ